jgi:YspA, cpYpsA-related SLOG family
MSRDPCGLRLDAGTGDVARDAAVSNNLIPVLGCHLFLRWKAATMGPSRGGRIARLIRPCNGKPSSAALRPQRRVQGQLIRAEGRPRRPAMVAGLAPAETLAMDHDLDYGSLHSAFPSSPTDALLGELRLHGCPTFADGDDPRPLPDDNRMMGAVADIFDALIATLDDTRAEPDLEGLLWGTVYLFHRAAERVERLLDTNEQDQRDSQREQDGSEVASVELERLLATGQHLIERRDALELMRDQAVILFERQTHQSWRPRHGSLLNHRAMTASVIDSREFVMARRRTQTEILLPPGPKVALTGGTAFNDHNLIWAKLDQVQVRHPDMVLLHGGSDRGAELIAAKWAETRKVPQIAFKPDWNRHAKAAPFKRNDAMLEVLPIGVIVLPGTGIQDNLADKARKLGIPVWRCGGPG